MIDFKVNEHLSLKLEEGKTNVYVKDKLFRQCKYLLLTMASNESDVIKTINSIDDAIDKLSKSLETQDITLIKLSPETIFWGHCSNFQVWYENNYNTCLIHRNLAFPLLLELTKAGDKLAKKVFKDEIGKRFATGHLTTIQFLLYNDYLRYLTKEEKDCIWDESSLNLTENIINKLKMLFDDSHSKYWKIINVLEMMLFIALKYDKNYFFPIIDHLPERIRSEFVKKLILYLNYKEFSEYIIPYGKFFRLFEIIIEFLYDNYPDMIKCLEGGFYGGRLSLDDMYSVGTIVIH